MALLAAYLEEVRIWIGRLADGASEVASEKIYEIGGVVFSTKVDELVNTVNVKTAQISDFIAAYDLTIMNPKVVCGMFIGAMMAFVFSAMTMKAVGRAAGAMVNEVRRQFKEIPGILEGTGQPDYAECVSISTAGAQKEMVLPSALAIIVPVATGLFLGVGGRSWSSAWRSDGRIRSCDHTLTTRAAHGTTPRSTSKRVLTVVKAPRLTRPAL